MINLYNLDKLKKQYLINKQRQFKQRQIEDININRIFNNSIKYSIKLRQAYFSIPKPLPELDIVKQSEAYLISHLGLGDNIINIGAVNFLLYYYETIYVLCKKTYIDNVKLLFEGVEYGKVIPFYTEIEFDTNLNNIITNPNADIFISGDCNLEKNMKSKITHPQLKKYKPYNLVKSKYTTLNNFYKEIGLDILICLHYFNINSSEKSIDYYNEIKNYKIIFIHSKSSIEEINFDKTINLYKNNEEYIMICANKNVYSIDNSKYNIAERYINLPIAYYIDIIKKSDIIHVIDSCFCCIVYPLNIMQKLKTNKVFIYGCRAFEVENPSDREYLSLKRSQVMSCII